MRGYFLAILACIWSIGLSAQDLDFDLGLTQTCAEDFQTLEEKSQCIGHSAKSCMDANDMGQTTMGMSGCAELELNYWDKRLNEIYGMVMKDAKARDAENAEYSSVPKVADALKEMQRKWIGYRDASCEYEASLWGGGTGAGPAYMGCLMHLTGRQALFFESHVENR